MSFPGRVALITVVAALIVATSGPPIAAQAPRAPAPQAVQAPPACGVKPSCVEEVSFAAWIADFQAILQNDTNKTVTARVTFRNKLNRPLALGLVSGSGVATDERGNRYAVEERLVQGIGLVQGASADAKFMLQPGEQSDTRFEFTWRTSGREIYGLRFQIDLAIREIDAIAGAQVRLGREHALHFSGLGSAATESTRPPAGVPPTDAPQSAVPPSPIIDACSGRPRCYNAGVFAAEVLSLIPSALPYSQPIELLQARVRFRNQTAQTIVLGYLKGSAVVADNFGSRFDMNMRAYGAGAQGIGTVDRESVDPQFVLAPGAASDATFTLTRGRNRTDRVGTSFRFDFTIAQVQVLPGDQLRTGREYTVGFSDLVTSAALSPRGSEPLTGASRSGSPGGSPAEADGCGGNPRCYHAGPFTAELTALGASTLPYSIPVDVLEARIRFRNTTAQPLVLAYKAGTAVLTDEIGNRFLVTTAAYGDGAKGIGVAEDGKVDPRFVVSPRGTSDATFTVSKNHAAGDRSGKAFNLDVVIEQLEVLDSRQVRTIREFAVGMTGLTASGPSLLNRLLQKGPQ